MTERDVRERDILVAPNEYAYVQDLTKGDIVLYVGPTKISLSNTERLTVYRDGRFVPVRGDDAGLGVHRFVEARSSQYIVLENPPQDATVQPVKGANSSTALLHGRKVVVPGPATFPLWPGQKAQVVDGHELEPDEYLLVRVYDRVEGEDWPIGTEQIVRGTELSFYVPRTGLEVELDPSTSRYVRKAIRLERSQGLHLRFIRDVVSEGDDLVPDGSYRAGQELFIRDREGYFFPMSNIEVVGRVGREPVGEKEGLYIRRFDSGEISTVEGPMNYLPDPTCEELVSRRLSDEQAALYGVEGTARGRALAIDVPPATAVMITGKSRREVVIGPQTRILGFFDELEVLRLSTGKPKRDEHLLSTCFLQIDANKVSDRVAVKTRDHVDVEVFLSYRVSFTGDEARWFSVEDYVGLLCDHLGSIIRAAARSVTIEEFHSGSTELLRGAVLGSRSDDGKRVGRHFTENGMWVYDVEVLDVTILDDQVQDLLTGAQRAAIVSDIGRKAEERRLGDERLREQVNREIYAAQIQTVEQATAYELCNRSFKLAQIDTELEGERRREIAAAEEEAQALRILSAAELDTLERRTELEGRALASQALAFRDQMQALAPELIATLKQLGGQTLAAELSRNLSPLAILGGESVADVAARLLDRLPMGPSATNLSALLPAADAGTAPTPDED